MDRLAESGYYRANKITKAGMIRSGLRLYLQQMVPEKWEELELGPPPEEIPKPPPPVIDAEAVEIPLEDA
jgi:hypothetical protein